MNVIFMYVLLLPFSFAVVVVGSDNSSRLIFEKLPKREVHGQVPQISNCNRQALSQFEAQARKGEPPAQNGTALNPITLKEMTLKITIKDIQAVD